MWLDTKAHDEAVPVLMPNQCPHRGARLSLGTIEQDEHGRALLRCGYHGWQFGASGQCVSVPSSPQLAPPANFAVACLGTQTAHGLVWANLGLKHGATAPAFDIPGLDHLPERRLIYGPFDVATSAPRAVENFLDTAHFAYVHEGWLGDAAHPEVPPYDVTLTDDGRPCIERYQAWQPRGSASSQNGEWVDYRYEVLSPYSALLEKQGQTAGPKDAYVIWACPTTDTTCRLWFAHYTNDTDSTDEALRDFQVTIFSQDQPILESQQPAQLPIGGGEAMAPSDKLSLAYRRYLRQCGVSCGVC
jgi:phenylpropionate dioxygenase-like ring-hydroxylating dioxygenase large terminal subunit